MTETTSRDLTEPRSARAEHALHPARRRKRGEARLAPAVAVLVAITLYAVLDRRADHLPVGDRARCRCLG
jgi:hypothetical protein